MGFRQLYVTFTTEEAKEEVINNLKETYDILYKKIYVFSSEELPNQLLLSYNIESGNHTNKLESTILLHRNPVTSTMYTIDALNKIILKENDGVLDKTFKINWESYKKKLLITEKSQLKVVSLNLIEVVSA